MTKTEVERRRRRRDDLGLVSFGFFLFLIGVIYVLNPSIGEDISAFFQPTNWKVVPVAPGVFLPAPMSHYPTLYLAVAEFAFIFGIFHVGILAARFAIGSPLSQKASTVSSIVFWLGLGFFLDLLATGAIAWWEFATGAVIIIGLGLIAQGAALALGRSMARERPHPYP
mgnify:CR=1 FL=1